MGHYHYMHAYMQVKIMRKLLHHKDFKNLADIKLLPTYDLQGIEALLSLSSTLIFYTQGENSELFS